MNTWQLVSYIAMMALVTYLIRMLPFTVLRKKVTSVYLRSFLYYVPYAVLGAMTIPAIFTSTGSLPSAIAGFAAAMVLACLRKSLLTVALAACGTAYIVQLVMNFL